MGEGGGVEILLQDLFTPVGKYFSYYQWEFLWVQLVLLPLILSLSPSKKSLALAPLQSPTRQLLVAVGPPSPSLPRAAQPHCSQHPTCHISGLKQAG